VSREAGRPYHDKLLPLPAFLWRGGAADGSQIGLGLCLTEHFLLRHAVLPHGRTMPAARARLVARLQTRDRDRLGR
jgi:DNA repair protein RecO (recombination protein O)